ncbi:MAG TPA: serine hydrolase [Vicinamibacterales bacterium]|nr:serine hydrolase [Vicinamibacterales bacterium]
MAFERTPVSPRIRALRPWSKAALAAVGLILAGSPVGSQTPFDAAGVDVAARALPQLRSLLVSRRGQVMVERYYGGARADRPANVKSASKSVISALVGIAVERGLVKGVREPIATYFPELRAAKDPARQGITVEDLLTMRSGLASTSGRRYGAWVTSRNWVEHVLSRPMTAAPGATMDYSTGNTHLLSAILTKATGRTTWSFANEVLAKPLGFRLPPWPRDPQGIYFGGNDMLMTSRQLLAFAELYLNGGRAGGQQVLPAAWVRKSCEGRPRELPSWARGRGPGDRPDPLRDRKYGYGWWVDDLAGHETCFAWGYGGQYAFVVPDLQLVIVTTSSPDVSEERRDHRRQLIDLVTRLVVEPLASLRD